MTKRRPQPEPPAGLPHDDPRRPLKINRLRKEYDRIPLFAQRAPAIKDDEFEEWEGTVALLLQELFGTGEFLIRFRQLRFRPISYRMDGYAFWSSDAPSAWASSLQTAEKILNDALEELQLTFPQRVVEPSMPAQPPQVVITVQNQNVFSPTLHVTVPQLLDRLETLNLSEAEKALAREHLHEIKAETEGEKRWPIIARGIESMKSLGREVYKEIAVPLIVEFLKREAGIPTNQ